MGKKAIVQGLGNIQETVMGFLKRTGNTVKENSVAITLGGTAIVGVTTAITSGFSDQLLPKNREQMLNTQFPPDASSAGGFLTEISFFSWKSNSEGLNADEDVNQQRSEQTTNLLGIMRLPMPLQLETGYASNFSEGDNMIYDRTSSMFGAVGDKLGGGGFIGGTSKEIMNMGNKLGELNNSQKMSGGSINNPTLGLIYEGGGLRGHTFTWRLSAKDTQEQEIIKDVISGLKLMSMPHNNFTGSYDLQNAVAMARANSAKAADDAVTEDSDIGAFLGGRLTIPPTCTVRFLDNDKENLHLFKIKDSFITNVQVNYTSQGTWQAHADGSPTEVQITITLKEIRTIVHNDVVFGY